MLCAHLVAASSVMTIPTTSRWGHFGWTFVGLFFIALAVTRYSVSLMDHVLERARREIVHRIEVTILGSSDDMDPEIRRRIIELLHAQVMPGGVDFVQRAEVVDAPDGAPTAEQKKGRN